MLRRALPLLLCLAAFPTAAEEWSEREICRAGIQAFFALPSPPVDDAEAEFRGHMGFRGQVGIIQRQYACRVQEHRIAIRWFVDGHRKRNARSTWVQDGDALVVTVDGVERRFGG